MEEPKDIYTPTGSDTTRLDVIITRNQKKQLDLIHDQTGRSLSDLVREGIAIVIGGYLTWKEGKHD